MKDWPYLAAALCVGAAAACAPTAQTASAGGSGRDCFSTNLLSGYSVVGDNTIRVSANPSRAYDLDLQGPSCSDVRWANAVAVVSKPSSFICTGNGLGIEVSFRDSVGSRAVSCYITNVRRYVKTTPSPN